MKKLLVLAAVIVAGIAANAASFKWSAANIYGPDSNKYTGTALIYATGVEGSIATATVTSGTLSYTGDWAGAVVGNNYDFYFVIEDSGKAYTSATKTAPAQATTTQTVAFGNQASATQNASNWAAVPEPTSGLLLLLGMAGLALKRKRA